MRQMYLVLSEKGKKWSNVVEVCPLFSFSHLKFELRLQSTHNNTGKWVGQRTKVAVVTVQTFRPIPQFILGLNEFMFKKKEMSANYLIILTFRKQKDNWRYKPCAPSI